MNKSWGVVTLVVWMALWGSARGWAAEHESQG